MTTKQHIVAKTFDKQGRLLSCAKNSYTKTHPLQSFFANLVGLPHKVYLHAEIAALIGARCSKIHTLHVSRYNKRGGLLNAKPCAICEEAIRYYGVKYVYYSNNMGEIVKMIFKRD